MKNPKTQKLDPFLLLCFGDVFVPVSKKEWNRCKYKGGSFCYDGKPLYNLSSKGVQGNERQPIPVSKRKKTMAKGRGKGT